MCINDNKHTHTMALMTNQTNITHTISKLTFFYLYFLRIIQLLLIFLCANVIFYDYNLK